MFNASELNKHLNGLIIAFLHFYKLYSILFNFFFFY